MPCALTSPYNYPDYLKITLKEIEIGDDENLKIAACGFDTGYINNPTQPPPFKDPIFIS